MVVIWRDWLTDAVMAGLGLNERQQLAIVRFRQTGSMTNAEYQALVGCSRRSALRDLGELVQKGVVQLKGAGRGAIYELIGKRARNAPNAPENS